MGGFKATHACTMTFAVTRCSAPHAAHAVPPGAAPPGHPPPLHTHSLQGGGGKQGSSRGIQVWLGQAGWQEVAQVMRVHRHLDALCADTAAKRRLRHRHRPPAHNLPSRWVGGEWVGGP